MTSPVDIVNMALSQIKSRSSVTSINPSDGSNPGNIASLLYQTVIDGLARAAYWNCMRFQAPLTLLKAAAGTPENISGTVIPITPQGYLYEYQQPTNPYALAIRYLVPGAPTQATVPPLTTAGGVVLPIGGWARSVPFITSVDLDALGNPQKVILTNAENAQAIYTMRVNDPTLWDASFTHAAIASLAAWFAKPVTGSAQEEQAKTQQAIMLLQQARIRDGNEGTTSSDHIPDWIRIRSGAPINLTGQNNVVPWDYFSLPGVLV